MSSSSDATSLASPSQRPSIARAFPAASLLARLESRVDREAWVSYLPSPLRLPRLSGVGGTTPGGASSAGVAPEEVDIVETIRVMGRVWFLSQQAHGCRWVQRALADAAGDAERVALALELRGHVLAASQCPYANHVLQKCIVVSPPEVVRFITQEVMLGPATLVARHKYGCRIVQRLVERGPHEGVRDLVERILQDVASLSRHQYGTYVVKNVLEHGSPEDRRRIEMEVEGRFCEYCADRFGCSIVVSVFGSSSPAWRLQATERLMEDRNLFHNMAGSKPGALAFIRMLEVLEVPARDKAVARFRKEVQALSSSRWGRAVMDYLDGVRAAGDLF